MVYDSGRKEKCDKDFPLLARLRAGPDEEVAKLYIVESDSEVGMNVSAEVSRGVGIILQLLAVQWNLSTAVTIGTQLSVLYRELSLIQRWISTQIYVVVTANSVLIREVS